MNPRAKKNKDKIVPKVVVRNVMFKRKATKVSIGGTEEQARKIEKRYDIVRQSGFYENKI